jgi:Zn-dependent peptidase ImmA (M78 family)
MREQKILLPTEAGEGDHRPLLGAILAYRGKAIITVDSTLPDPLRRFVVAHEIAHFLLDYRIPRQRVVNRLGPSIIPVLDGLRTVQLEDELAALLAGVRLGLYAHYLKRDEEWQKSGKAIETQADALAFELLAPWAEVYARLAFLPDPQQAEAVLQHEYGFPADHANYYARQLQDHARKNPSPSAQWGL